MSVFFEFSSWILLFSTDFNLTAKSYQNLSDARMYYKCEKGGTFSDEALTIKFKEFKVQAFNVENGDFSKNGMSYICLYTQYYFFLTVFVPGISRKRLDQFLWNFYTWYLMTKCYNNFFCFDGITSGFKISMILWFLINNFVQIVSPKWVKIDIWNFYGCR